MATDVHSVRQALRLIGQVALQHDIEQPFENRLGISRQPGLEAHRRCLTTWTRAASILRSRRSTT
jgi:hypothetical protein